ncbi:MAG: B12-binding domain-containing radical SAM protein [Ignavibacteriales bacterium]|nr:B12-binding domain-containing radical SAM protein [Ignavibacteriales bacterium]MCF8314688.1 B12-binding domain-containing radical SAM protein [Ignavibacteriales bacterium]MCF8436275.1 B12-binding domain-containing radical SAM protein [Ignavibacteriales bacterium]
MKKRILLLHYQIIRGKDRFLLNVPNLSVESIAGNIDRSQYEVKTLSFNSVSKGKLKNKDNISLEGSNKRNYFLNILKEYQPDIVGLSSKTGEFYSTIEIVKIVKSFNPDIVTVLGGYHATINYQEILESKDGDYFDFLIRGEGERTFNKLLEAIFSKQEPVLVDNVSYKFDSKIINNQKGFLLDLERIKLPDRQSRINKKNFKLFGFRTEAVETSRGCVFDCTFCCITEMYGKSFRKYKIERVIEDIKDTQKHGAKFVLIVDDNITIDTQRLEKLCDAIINAKLNNLSFVVQASIGGLKKSPTIVAKMKKAGISVVLLGIETSDEEELQKLSKLNQFKSDDIRTVVLQLKKHRIFSVGLFIIGTPEETKKTLIDKFEYSTQLGLDQIYFSILTPFPGTVIRKELIEKKLITNKHDYSKYSTWHANISTLNLSSSELFQLTRELEKKYSLQNRFIINIIRYLPEIIFRLTKLFIYNNSFLSSIKGRFEKSFSNLR